MYAPDVQCVGTSATMATSETFAQTQETVADVATRLFGTGVAPDRVIGESLRRATSRPGPGPGELRDAIGAALAGSARAYEALTADPLAGWIETTFGLTTETQTNRLIRQRPVTVPAAAERLAQATGLPVARCQAAIQAVLQEGARATDPRTGWPLSRSACTSSCPRATRCT